jgi:hypothetical protein
MNAGWTRLAVSCLLGSSLGAQTATSRIVNAANTFLSALEEKQRHSVLFRFDDEQQRVRWSKISPFGWFPAPA